MNERFYKLNCNYVLRGWDNLPFAIIDRRTNIPTFVPRAIMLALQLCDGEHNIESPLVPDEHRTTISDLLKRKLISPCREGDKIKDEQRYYCYPTRFLSQIQWSVTGRCNFRCKHCMMSAPDAALGELSFASLLKIVDQLAECGILNVLITGGEFLVRNDIPELLEALVSKGIRIPQIYTNGALLNEDVLDMFANLGQTPDVVISFDGVGHHDWLRGIQGAERITGQAFKLCHERGLTTKAQVSMHRGNISSLRATVCHLSELNCSIARINPVTAQGNWLINGRDMTLTTEELFEAELSYIPHYFEDGMPLSLILSGLVAFSPEQPNEYVVLPYKKEAFAQNQFLLRCARHSIHISANGFPAICELAQPFGSSPLVKLHPIVSDDPNAETTPLRDILAGSSPFMKALYLRGCDLIDGGGLCASCQYFSVCAGGCRAMAFRTSGDLFGPDPEACTFFKDGWAKRLISRMREIKPDATSAILRDPLFQAT